MKIENLEDLIELFRGRAGGRYGLSAINQLQHALQAGHLAEARGAAPALVIACLFHDVGHLLGREDDAPADRGIDDRHERSGAKVLARVFGPAVSEPVRLHVAAKRYLCTTDPAYHDRLSPDSVRSLGLQGGLMAADELMDFEREFHGRDALFLRRCDEDAKDPAAHVPGLDHYLATARSLALPELAAE